MSALRRHVDSLLDGAQDGVYGVDRRGYATLVTPSLVAMTGHAPEEVVGKAIHDVLHHSHANGERYPREQCPIFAACRDGHLQHAEEVFWRKDGSSFPIEYTTTPLIDRGDVVGSVVVFRDLLQRREVREGFRRVLEQLGPSWSEDTEAAPVGASAAWLSAMNLARRVAPVDTTVLLVGESGTGKEVIARAIHHSGPRSDRPLVTLNCAAIPASLIESELFGHERGAFTGAIAQRVGRFEQAEDGTLFLDEIGELSLEAQAKLLRVLQAREFERVGGTRGIPCRARIIAATNRDLRALVAAGRFRLDLYYRLSVFPMRLPPLRERPDDIPLLVRHFLRKLEPRFGRVLKGFSPAGERRLLTHYWPGNVRELENVVERAALLSDGAVLDVPELEADGLLAPAAVESPGGGDAVDRAALVAALDRSGWRVTGARGAAAALGLHPNTVRKRMRRLGLRRPAE